MRVAALAFMANKSLFSCRIVDISSYNAAPVKDLDVCYSEFRSRAVEKVPVVRIFGSTPAGQKTCLHVHGIFPYIYVLCPISDPTSGYLQQLACSIDQGLQLSLGSKSGQHHVFKITVVKGIPMYGYHDNEELFLKIYLYNPSLVKRLSDLLVAGVVMGTVLQPHEAHIPFALQMMIDYNLYGMNYVHISSVKFRSGKDISVREAGGDSRGVSRSPPLITPPLISPPPLRHSSPSPLNTSLVPTPSQQVWDVDTLPRSMLLCAPRVSESDLEVDAIAADITNIQQLSLSQGSYPGLASIWEEERQRRRQLGLSTTLTPPPSPDRFYDSTLSAELAATMEGILKERLGRSVSPMASPTLSFDAASVPLSCDTQSHRPISVGSPAVARRLSLESSSDREEEAEKKGAGPVVNEEAFHQAMELSQKLRIEKLRKSTDEELLDLMLELAQTQVGMATQPSQSVYQTPTVADRLCNQLKKSLSFPTTSSSHDDPRSSLAQSQPLSERHNLPGFTSLTASKQDLTTGSACSESAVDAGEDVAAMELQDVDKFLAIGENLLSNNSDEKNSTNGTVGVTIATKAADISSTRPNRDSELRVEGMENLSDALPVPLPHSPVFSNADLFDTDFSLDPPPSLPPSPPPDPETKMEGASSELEGPDEKDLVQDSSVMLNGGTLAVEEEEGENEELERSSEFDSPFDIPCGQRIVSQRSSNSSEEQAAAVIAGSGETGRERSRDDRSSSSEGGKRSVEVQLEYEMPEISLSQFESSVTEILGTPSKMGHGSAKVARGHTNIPTLRRTENVLLRTSTPFGGGFEAEASQTEQREDDVFAASDASSLCLTASQRMGLLQQLCSASGGDSGEVDEEVGEEGEVEVVCESEMEDEEEWRSGQWSTPPLTIPESPQEHQDSGASIDQLDGPIGRFGSNIVIDDSIGQLDGTPDYPKAELKRKTLGVCRQKSGRKQPTAKTHTDSPSMISDVIEDSTSSPPEKKRRKPCDADERESGGEMMECLSAHGEGVEVGEVTECVTGEERPSDVGNGAVMECESGVEMKSDSCEEKTESGVKMECESGVEMKCDSGEEKTESGVKMECGSEGVATKSVSTSESAGDCGVSVSQKEATNVSSHKLSELNFVEDVTATGTCSGMNPGKKLRVDSREPERVGTSKKKSKLSLSLSSRKRHHLKTLLASTSSSSSAASSPAVSSPALSTFPLTRDNINTHPLTVQLKTRAIRNPPRVCVRKIPHSEISEESTKPVVDGVSESSFTSPRGFPSSGRVSKHEKSRKSTRATKHGTRFICTRTRFLSEKQALEWAICESLRLSSQQSEEESFSIQSSGESCSGDVFGGGSVTRDGHAKDELRLELLSSDSDIIMGAEIFATETVFTEKGRSAAAQTTEAQSVTEGLVADKDGSVAVDAVAALTVAEKSVPALLVTEKRFNSPSSSSSSSRTHQSSSSLPAVNGSSILLAGVADTDHSVREMLSSLCGAEGMELDVSPSDTSSQGIESDFHLVVTESDSESSETVLLSSTKRGEEVGGRFGTATGEQSLFRSNLDQRLSSSYASSAVPLQLESPPAKIKIRPLQGPPTAARLIDTAATYGLPTAVHKKPFYSNPSDVQPPREVNRKSVKIPSLMAYELPEAEPPLLGQGSKYATPLSATGLHHWRTVLSMLIGSSPSAETQLPPHPPRVPNHQQPHYAIEDHKRDVRLRSTYFPTTKTLILTPLRRPPHPLLVREWLNSKTTASGPTEQKAGSVTMTTVPSVNESEIKETIRASAAFTPVSLKRDTSQLEGPTPQNTYGFKISQSAFATSCDTHEYLTIMSVELHVCTRGSLRPNPEWDPVLAVFYYIHHDYPRSCAGGRQDALGAIAIDVLNSGFQAVDITRQKSPRKRPIRSPRKQPIKSPTKSKSPSNDASSSKHQGNQRGQSSQTLTSTTVAKGYLSGCVSDNDVTYVSSEMELLDELVAIVRRHDPDILLGYEVTMMSWGYLIDRAASLNLNLTNQLSRVPHQPDNKASSERTGSGTGTRHKASPVRIPGRIVVSVWRLMRKELALTSYSFENTYFQVMHQRIPMFSFQNLTQWYENGTHGNRAEVVEYYLLCCHGNYQLLEKLNLIGRTSEFARLYGIEFESVLTRGSQYRVESMLLRLAKPANYIAVSPSVRQRARMAAPECLPLILEPESKFYSDPVLVLDFQSLYPSIVIGYNYCYTTCLGRVRNLALHGDFTLGTNSLNVPTHTLKRVRNNVSISPNGVVFVTPNIRRGLMPRMLEEILGTRIMVKTSMKRHKEDKALNRMLDARQMGLKLIANVTYGYTAANFSGRMPCVEVADSIVGKARETLERAIKLITRTTKWRARVVYGDTDSVFVLLKGVSKDEAFRIGREICECVTANNPKPVKLKFEKVYYPCILQTKKRYCGYMYETPDQMEPCYDAKGIETVRRDTCPAVAKILQKSLSLLFSTYDVSQVKSYVQRQARKLLDGHVSIQDYILAKEYRGHGNYRPGACVPALELARRATAVDPRAEPRPGERVPYVVVYGHPGQPLIQLVRPPLDVVKDHTLRLNGVYYITKQVLPALDRALSLLGVDVYQWYNELTRVFRAPLPPLQETTNRKSKGTLGQYFASMHCPICDELTMEGVCSRCRGNPQKVATVLSQRIRDLESAHYSVTMLCHSCTRSTDPTYPNHCTSLDCPVFYRRHHTLHTLTTVTNLTKHLHTCS